MFGASIAKPPGCLHGKTEKWPVISRDPSIDTDDLVLVLDIDKDAFSVRHGELWDAIERDNALDSLGRGVEYAHGLTWFVANKEATKRLVVDHAVRIVRGFDVAGDR